MLSDSVTIKTRTLASGWGDFYCIPWVTFGRQLKRNRWSYYGIGEFHYRLNEAQKNYIIFMSVMVGGWKALQGLLDGNIRGIEEFRGTI